MSRYFDPIAQEWRTANLSMFRFSRERAVAPQAEEVAADPWQQAMPSDGEPRILCRFDIDAAWAMACSGNIWVSNEPTPVATPVPVETRQPDSEGWIAHAPGPCPVPPKTLVRIRCRHGNYEGFGTAEFIAGGNDWWDYPADGMSPENQVVAYRIVS